jgi:hypothetical protein
VARGKRDYDRDEKAARARARELWRGAVPGWHVTAELPDPPAFAGSQRDFIAWAAAELLPALREL